MIEVITGVITGFILSIICIRYGRHLERNGK